jgi:rhodanese-related sulfurtransferase
MPDESYRLPEITVHELVEWMGSKPDLILMDVREASEVAYAPLRDPRVVHMPMSVLSRAQAMPAELTPDKEIVVFCHVGGRSSSVVYWLNAKQGYAHVYNLRGGIEAYAAEIDPSIPRYA